MKKNRSCLTLSLWKGRYLKGRVTWREGAIQRDLPSLVQSLNGCKSQGEAGPKEGAKHWVSHVARMSPSAWVIFPCFPRCNIRELHWNSQSCRCYSHIGCQCLRQRLNRLCCNARLNVILKINSKCKCNYILFVLIFPLILYFLQF